MKKIFISCVLVVLSVSLWAQTTKPNTTRKPPAKTEPNPAPVVVPPTPPPIPVPASKQQDRPVDGYYKKMNIFQAKVVPLAPIREVDIIYSKRVWREIDIREMIRKALNRGTISAFIVIESAEGDIRIPKMNLEKAMAIHHSLLEMQKQLHIPMHLLDQVLWWH